MPLLKIQTNQDISQSQRSELLIAGSTEVAKILGKPERYVMVMITTNPDMIFSADRSPLAYLELKSIGLPGDRTAVLSEALCGLVQRHLGIPPDRTYIEFANAERHMWGWNGATF